MGVSIKAQENSNSNYVRSLYDVGEAFVTRLMSPWLWNERMFYWSYYGKQFKKGLDTLHGFTRKVIRERKAELLKIEHIVSNSNLTLEEFTPRRKAFLDLLLDIHIKDPDSITEEEIREEVDTIMFEGHDTTAMALSWCLHCVGLNPQVQRAIHVEMDSIFGDDKRRPVTQKDLREMKYLECVIKETLRLFPSVPYIGREVTQDIEIEGNLIPKGTSLVVFLYMLHRNPDVFPNPEVFDPDRFSSEKSNGRHAFVYCPFSAGPRNCVGQRFAMMEEKTVLAYIFRNFTLKSLEHRDQIVPVGELVIRPTRGIRIKVTPRSYIS